MPYVFPDLVGTRDLNITNISQLGGSAGTTGINMPNGDMYIIANNNTSFAAPGVYYPDSTGFFALPWGSGDEAITWEFVFKMATVSNTSHGIVAWGDPSDTTSGYAIAINSAEQISVQCYDSAAGVYLSSLYGVTSGIHYIIHIEIRCGATRDINIWLNNTLAATPIKTGPTGSPSAITGNERLHIIGNHVNAINTQNVADPYGKLALYKRRLTNEERDRHQLAMFQT